MWEEIEEAIARRAALVLEASHPPSYRLPWADVARRLLQRAVGESVCERKGSAEHRTLVDGTRRLKKVPWSTRKPRAGLEPVAECVAFCPGLRRCAVGGRPVGLNLGISFSGWITPELAGPFKGFAGRSGW